MPVVPSIGALLAGIGADLAAILTVLKAIGPVILPLLNALRAGGAGNQKPGGQERGNIDQARVLHPLGFQRDGR
jgi:hypothetical protein